jgi:hypothetical protein
VAKPNLDDYVTVAERVERFYKEHPDGSLQTEILHDDGKRVVMRARAFRSPQDQMPGIGHAEEIRGQGMVNKTSALENCETSAWGRAIAALGFEVTKGIASREEVEQAQAEEQRQQAEGKPLVTEAWANDARRRVRNLGVDVNEVRMKLTAMNAGRLEELTESQAATFDQWLSEKADQVEA